MNLTEVLQILQEVNKLLTALEAMGLKISGTVDLPTLLKLFGVSL